MIELEKPGCMDVSPTCSIESEIPDKARHNQRCGTIPKLLTKTAAVVKIMSARV